MTGAAIAETIATTVATNRITKQSSPLLRAFLLWGQIDYRVAVASHSLQDGNGHSDTKTIPKAPTETTLSLMVVYEPI